MIQDPVDITSLLVPIGSVAGAVVTIVIATWKVRGYLDAANQATNTKLNEMERKNSEENTKLAMAISELNGTMRSFQNALTTQVTQQQSKLWIYKFKAANPSIIVPDLE